MAIRTFEDSGDEIKFGRKMLNGGTNTKATINTIEGHISSSGNLKIDGSIVDFTNLPTSDPSVAGRLWNDSNTVKISSG